MRDATLNKGGHALTAVQVMEQSMMWFYGRAAYEQAKPEGDRNEKTMREDLLRAAKIAADVASYQQAKLTRTVLTGDSEGGPIPVSMTGELAVVIKGGLPFDPQATPPATASAPVDTTPPTE